MVYRRKRGRNNGGCSVDNEIEHNGESEVSCPGYEQFRDQRIKENMERMQKLGIFELSLKLKKSDRNRLPKTPSEKKTPNEFATVEPPRRSSRLKSLTPRSYSEIGRKSKNGTLRSVEIYIKEGSQPEIYTDVDEKLLGDCKSSWVLCMDGYDQAGNRLLDPIRGETCHQCRQKALGQHTHCSKCNLVQGQFCGDCLYMRYGENVMEANANPEWICPVCRGICNCSLCRKSKGWAPTGALYRKVCKLGFKSVAHYLIQTRKAEKSLKDSSTENKVGVDSGQVLAITGLEIHLCDDDSQSSVNDLDFEGEMEEAPSLDSENMCKNGVNKEDDDIDDLVEKTDGA